MDVARLVLEYVRTLAWPVIVLTAILLLRRPVVGFIGETRRFRLSAGGAELEAERREVEQALEASAANLVEPPENDTDAAENRRRAEIERLIRLSLRHGWRVSRDREPPEVRVKWGEDGTPDIEFSRSPEEELLYEIMRRLRQAKIPPNATPSDVATIHTGPFQEG